MAWSYCTVLVWRSQSLVFRYVCGCYCIERIQLWIQQCNPHFVFYPDGISNGAMQEISCFDIHMYVIICISTWLPPVDIFATTMSLIFIHSNGKHDGHIVWILLIYTSGTEGWTKTIPLCYLSLWIEILVCINIMALNIAGSMIDDCFIVCILYVLWARNIVVVPKNNLGESTPMC